MNIGERILLSLSKSPLDNDYLTKNTPLNLDNALDLLSRVYPNFKAIVSGKDVVDFGCGFGYQSIALVKKYDCSVVGVDSNRQTLSKAIDNARYQNISSQKLDFVERISEKMLNSFDIVISQNSFEHFSEPEKVLDEMGSLLNDSGMILLSFGPPWLAPYGSHMHFFCKVPWVNVLFPEKVVMKARSHFRDDGAEKYEDVESGLNKMTIAKFEAIVSSCDFEVIYKKYDCVKGINCVSKLPLLREFFINHVTTILSRAK